MYAEAVARGEATAATGAGAPDRHVRLLTFGVSPDDSARQISSLRNAGIAASSHSLDERATAAGDDEEAAAELILVAANKTCQPSTVATLRKIGGGANIIALTEDRSGSTAAEWLDAGAADVVQAGELAHFVAVVRRELENLHVQRELSRVEAENADFERRCQALLESSREAICYVHDGMFVYANPAYLEMFGLEQADDIEGLTVLDLVDASDHGRIKKALRTEAPATHEEVLAVGPEGQNQRLQFEFSPARVEGEPCQQLIVRKAAVVDAEALKGHDLLTGLRNRSGILEHLADTLQNEIVLEGQLSLLYVDTDRFRAAVDQVGLGATDIIVADLANVLRSCLSERDIVGRIGDSSFVVILMDRGKRAVSELAQRIREAFAGHISEAAGQSVNLTCSVGICEWLPGMNADSLVAAAASAAETASKAGGNQSHVYAPDAGADGDADKQWVDAVQNALSGDGFHLVYQPVVHLQGQVQDHYEVLLRMTGENGQIVLPGFFLPPAERHGLMPDIDRWVIGEAVRTLGRRAAQSRATTLFVKLTTDTLQDESLLPWLKEQFDLAEIDGRNLIFEMPEAQIRTQLKKVAAFVKGGRELGCRFTIEQFAGDDNAFQLLDHVEAHFLKLDRALMSELPQRQDNRARLTEMAARAASMGKQTIAEFVEDAASMSILWQSGVNFVQGHFLQEPEKVLAYEF